MSHQDRDRLDRALIRLDRDAETTEADAIERHGLRQIDTIRDQSDKSTPVELLSQYKTLVATLGGLKAGKIGYRLAVNMGLCYLRMGDVRSACPLLISGYDYAPNEPLAVAHRVLGHWLEGNSSEAVEFGLIALELDPSNSLAAYYIVQARADLENEDNPLAGIPDNLHHTADLSVARIVFLRRRGRSSDWWGYAEEAAKLHPKDRNLEALAALAVVDQITDDHETLSGRVLTHDIRERIVVAGRVLDSVWRERRNELREPLSGVGQFFVGALVCARMLHDTPLVREMLQIVDNEELKDYSINHTAVMAADALNEHDLADRLIARSEPHPSLRFVEGWRKAQRGDWEAAAALFVGAAIPDTEREGVATIQAVAPLLREGVNPTDEEIRASLSATGGEPRAVTLVARAAHRLGREELARKIFTPALAISKADQSLAVRTTAASLASDLQLHTDVVDLLDEKIYGVGERFEYKMLAISHHLESPRRERNVRFYNDLPGVLTIDYEILCRKLNLLCELDRREDALTLARDLREQRPTDVFPIATTVQLLHGPETIAELRAELAGVDVSQLVGSVEQRAVVVRGIRAIGDAGRAALYAYELACEAPQSEAAVAALAFMPFAENFEGRSGDIFPKPKIVDANCFVELKSRNGDVDRFIVDDGADVFGTSVHNLNHPLVVLVLGRGVGYQFSHQNPFGFSEHWTIETVDSKQAYLCRKLISEWGVRFPTSRAMGSLKMEEGDVTPLLQMARQGDTRERKFVEAHATSVFPLALCARALGSDPISFAQRIRHRGHRIRTRHGQIAYETGIALRVAREARGKGVVLDPFTAITAAAVDALGSLRSYFGELYVTSSALRLLDGLARDAHVGTGIVARELLLAASVDLKSIGAETELLAVSYLRDMVREHCIIEPGLLSDDAPPELISAVADWGPRVMDTASLANARKLPVLSEDFSYRAVLHELVKIDGFWLEPALRLCFQENILTEADHVRFLAQLSSLGHGRPPVSVRNMIVAFENGSEDGLRDYKALALQIAGSDVDMFAHTHFTWLLFRNLWDLHVTRSPLKVRMALGVVLTRLVCRRGFEWPVYISILLRLSKHRKMLRGYIIEWLIGHFFIDAQGAPILRGDRHGRRRMQLGQRPSSPHSRRAFPRGRMRGAL